MVITWGSEPNSRLEEVARTVIETPFTRRTWSELLFMMAGMPIAFIGIAFVGFTMAAGVVLAITFIGIALIGVAVRGARGIGTMQRRLAGALLDEAIDEPEPFSPRPGYLGWLQSALRDRTGWKAMAYLAVKVPLAIFAFFTAFSLWWDALRCLTYPLWGIDHSGGGLAEWGAVRIFFQPSYLSPEARWALCRPGHGDHRGDLLLRRPVAGAVLRLPRPPAHADPSRPRCHDGQGAQLSSRPGPRPSTPPPPLCGGSSGISTTAPRPSWWPWPCGSGWPRRSWPSRSISTSTRSGTLVNDAHKGAKEAIVELRDLARGIHPPALDVGLEGALATLAARSTVPTELAVTIDERPSPAIEAIAYFCVAELMANVAQHAFASRASVSCAQQGRWLRLVVRDDGVGGAQTVSAGSTSSGLSGLADRVRTVDGNLEVTSPPRGPTVVTVDLPLRA